ncbi:MAG: disulfide bond formation protein B [Deltaproteobacteria bacterium]|jgi:disulfide bond formation protein DsbB|nr:disulfide bond formation protein B [Deltaproteobacteria bacterium]
MSKAIRQLIDDFFGTLKTFENHRAIWLLGAALAISLEVFSVLWFQNHLGLWPCEYCVIIRFDVLMVAAGCLLAAAWPRALPVRLAGLLVAFFGAISGLVNTLKLEVITLKSQYIPGYYSICRPGSVGFPLGLKPDKLFPLHFQALGICGENQQWYLLGLSMTQWLIVVFLVMLTCLTLTLAALFVRRPAPKNFGGPGQISTAH